MKLSIIIPVYNAESFLEFCIDTLYQQQLPSSDFEVIVINDGSLDKSLEVAEKLKRKYGNIHIFSDINRGQSAARNKGVGLAKGEYIYFVDADDYLNYGNFKAILSFMDKFNLQVFAFDSSPTLQRSPSEITVNLPSEIKTFKGMDFIGDFSFNNSPCYYILRKDFIFENKLQFIEGRLAEDGIFTANMWMHVARGYYYSMQVYMYYQNPNSTTTNSKDYGRQQKLINDMLFAVQMLDRYIETAISGDAPKKAIHRLQVRKESYGVFSLIRILKLGYKYTEAKKFIRLLQESKAYPFRNFIGEEYNGINMRAIVFVLNRPQLFYSLLMLRRLMPT